MDFIQNLAGRTYWPTEEWEKSKPEDQNVNTLLLEKAVEYITSKYPNNRSFLVIKNGILIFEAYNDSPYDGIGSKIIKNILHFALGALKKSNATFKDRRDGLDNIRSATKSIMSALVGIAIDKGYIESADEKAAGLLPDKYCKYFDADKKEITVGHLLTMKSGLANIDEKSNSVKMLFGDGDWLEYFLKKPMQFVPGSKFDYNSANPHLLSAVLSHKTDMSSLAFAKKHLFGPLGIENVYWETDGEGVNFGGGNLFMCPEDFAKIGFLYINGGKWDGSDIISGDWITQSLKCEHEWMYGFHYGYLWYKREERVENSNETYIAYSAAGAGGQLLFLIPELDVIVVTTSTAGMTRDKSYIINDILGKFIIPAIKTD